MATTESEGSSSSSRKYDRAVRAFVFLSIFMGSIYLMVPIHTENVDSIQKLEKLESELKFLSDQAPKSFQIMTNFTWPSGHTVVEAWIDLYWVRKLHMGKIPLFTWLIAAPLQLASEGGMKLYSRTTHKWLGYAFSASSVSLCTGIAMLIASGKVYGHPHWLAVVANILKLLYFAGTLVLAIWTAAIRRNIQEHKKWIIRHMTMGYTVSVQRILLFIVGPLLHAVFATTNKEPTSEEKQIWYNITTFLATVFPILVIEWTILKHPPKDLTKSD